MILKMVAINKIIVRLHDGTEKECDSIHKSILYLIKR